MKQGLKLALILVFLSFIVSACANYQNPFQKREREEVGRGLKLSFAPNTIPDTIRIRTPFPLIVEIENFGLAIPGYVRIYDQIDGNDVAFPIEGYETIPIPAADFVIDNDGRIRGNIVPGRIQFPRQENDRRVAYQEQNVFEGAKANIHAELIVEDYPVREKFSLCVKEEDVQGVPCSNNQIETFADARNQYRAVTYSPVTISRVEKAVTPLGNNEYFINLDITLSNVGDGEIIPKSARGGSLDLSEKYNAIRTPEVSYGGGALRCSPQNELVFVNKKAEFNCVGTTSLPSGQEYVDRITEINFMFNYKLSIKKGPIPILLDNRQ